MSLNEALWIRHRTQLHPISAAAVINYCSGFRMTCVDVQVKSL